MANQRETETPEPGVFSLTQIQHLMRVEFSRSQRYGYALSCVVLSVDDLGRLRDEHGFDAKERVVRTVADVVRLETRTSDYIGRTPDDRLLCIVPHTGGEGLEAMSARIMNRIQRLEFEGAGGMYGVSVSVGASSCDPGQTLFFDALIQSASAALSVARREGGGRFVLRDVNATVTP